MDNCTVKLTGTFDRCLECQFIGNGCSGPRTTAMTFERWIQWIKALKQMRREQNWKVSNIDIAENCGLAKNTVDNVFSGKNKDVSRTTAGLIEDYLIGRDIKWPCAMDLNSEKDIVFQDRPETLDALEQRMQHVVELQKQLDGIHSSYAAEILAIRNDERKKLDHLLEQIGRLREEVNYQRLENDRKSRIIDKWLSEE